jgi:sRNA-binding regulator protein Hfq
MKKTCLTLIAATCFAILNIQATTNLKLNLEKGKEYKINSTTIQNMVMTVNGMQMNTDVNSFNAITYLPDSLGKEYMIVKVTFDSVISNVNNPYRPMKINSNKPGDKKSPENLMSNVWSTLSKNPLIVKLSYTGKVIDIRNLNAIMDSVSKQLDSLPETMKPQMKGAVDNALSFDVLKMIVESAMSYLNDQPINSGDKWESKYTIKPSGMELSITTKFKCKNIENNQANISGDVLIESPENAVMNMGGQQAPFDLRGMGTSEMSVDLNTGLVIKGKMKQKMQGSMTIQGNPMPMNIESTTEIEAIK